MSDQVSVDLPTHAAPLMIGSVPIRNNVCLAPMSGLTDAPFRQVAEDLGAGLSFSEMVASRELAVKSEDAVRRLERGRHGLPLAVQLSGRDVELTAEAARIAEGAGADIIDLNLGCPARRVTGGFAGAALMREPERAQRLIDAVIAAVNVPVTVKMRLGWDDASRNAPLIALKAEQSGARMISVHARTRNQFYKGRADWAYVARVSEPLSIPLLINGDISSLEDAAEAMAVSGASGVMIGRGAMGRPWFPGQAAAFLSGRSVPQDPDNDEMLAIVAKHYLSMIDLYGEELGLRCARKHLAAYIEKSGADMNVVREWRGRICRSASSAATLKLLEQFYARDAQSEAA